MELCVFALLVWFAALSLHCSIMTVILPYTRNRCFSAVTCSTKTQTGFSYIFFSQIRRRLGTRQPSPSLDVAVKCASAYCQTVLSFSHWCSDSSDWLLMTAPFFAPSVPSPSSWGYVSSYVNMTWSHVALYCTVRTVCTWTVQAQLQTADGSGYSS